MKPEFVFVHSYSSENSNWKPVMVGSHEAPGRLLTALKIARDLDVQVIANDSFDEKNIELLNEFGITNLGSAKRTRDEVRSAIEYSKDGSVLFVTSPDHLPRVARDAMAMGATKAIFSASAVPFSSEGPAGVIIFEPKSADSKNRKPLSFGHILKLLSKNSKGN